MIYKLIKREEIYIGHNHSILQQRTDHNIGGDDFLLELLIRTDNFNKTKHVIINSPEVVTYFVTKYTKKEIIGHYLTEKLLERNWERYEMLLKDWDEFWEDLIF